MFAVTQPKKIFPKLPIPPFVLVMRTFSYPPGDILHLRIFSGMEVLGYIWFVCDVLNAVNV